MTIEKAIGYWKARYENTKYFDDVHCDADELREYEEYVEVLKETITALEKQMPKKVLNLMLNDGDGQLIKVFKGICPYCQCIVTNEYCSRCGQALDWSDENV